MEDICRCFCKNISKGVYENNFFRFFFDIFILLNVLDVCGKF